MARRLRIDLPGLTQHVVARGVDRCDVFRDDRDRLAFLARLAVVVRQREWRCLSYCLLGTHYHLLVETPRAGLGTGVQRLNGGHAQWFNRRWGRTGHLFEGRYFAVVVEHDGHLLELQRYIAQNPVRAGLCALPQEWPWSSYGALVRGENPPGPLDAARLLEFFGRPPAALRRLREFVESTADRPGV